MCFFNLEAKGTPWVFVKASRGKVIAVAFGYQAEPMLSGSERQRHCRLGQERFLSAVVSWSGMAARRPWDHFISNILYQLSPS